MPGLFVGITLVRMILASLPVATLLTAPRASPAVQCSGLLNDYEPDGLALSLRPSRPVRSRWKGIDQVARIPDDGADTLGHGHRRDGPSCGVEYLNRPTFRSRGRPRELDRATETR